MLTHMIHKMLHQMPQEVEVEEAQEEQEEIQDSQDNQDMAQVEPIKWRVSTVQEMTSMLSFQLKTGRSTAPAGISIIIIIIIIVALIIAITVIIIITVIITVVKKEEWSIGDMESGEERSVTREDMRDSSEQ